MRYQKKYQFNFFHLIISGIIINGVSASTASALDLNEAIELAQQHDTTFQIARENYLAINETSSQSASAVLPQIGFNAFIQRGRNEIDRSGSITKSDNNSDGYSLNLNQVIFDKTVFDKLTQGDATAAQALADFEAAKQDTVVRVSIAYFDILTAIAALETANAEKKAIGKKLDESESRFDVGMIPITDVKEQQASYDIAIADEIIAVNDLSNKREALRVLINVYPENLAILRDDIPLVVPEPMNINTWQEKALENNFLLLSTKHAVDVAQSAYDASRGGHYPTLNLNASYGVTNIDERDSGFTTTVSPALENTDAKVILSLDVPIYGGGFTSSSVRQKSHELNKAKARQEQEKRRTIATARSAYLTLEADIAQVKARKQAMISTLTSLDATQSGYEVGTRTSVDVLFAQRLLYSSQRDHAIARHSYITNSLELKRVAGILTLTDVDEINKWLMPRQEQ